MVRTAASSMLSAAMARRQAADWRGAPSGIGPRSGRAGRHRSIVRQRSPRKQRAAWSRRCADAVRQLARGRAGEGHHEDLGRHQRAQVAGRCAVSIGLAMAQHQPQVERGDGPGLAGAGAGLDEAAAPQRQRSADRGSVGSCSLPLSGGAALPPPCSLDRHVRGRPVAQGSVEDSASSSKRPSAASVSKSGNTRAGSFAALAVEEHAALVGCSGLPPSRNARRGERCHRQRLAHALAPCVEQIAQGCHRAVGRHGLHGERRVAPDEHAPHRHAAGAADQRVNPRTDQLVDPRRALVGGQRGWPAATATPARRFHRRPPQAVEPVVEHQALRARSAAAPSTPATG